MSNEMTSYVGKFKNGDCLVIKTGESLCAAYESFTNFPHGDVYWIPSEETIETISRKKLVVESSYYFHGGYPIYVLVFEKDGQEYECKICEIFLQKEGGSFNAKVTPTLYIALGGAGAEITLRLRSRILTHVWGSKVDPIRPENIDEFPLAQFIYYDLDATSVGPGKFRDDEKLLSNPDLLGKYMRTDGELCKFPHIASWFPLTRKKLLELGRMESEQSQLNIRAFSRLNFFDKYNELKNRIAGKIKGLLLDVSNQDKTNRLGLELEPASLRVVIIASTAGRTGSGAFLDMGYLAKVLAEIELPNGTRKVDLCLMLPSEYSGYGNTRAQANTHAALMELESCMGHGLQLVNSWSHWEDLNLPITPYDNVFLFDSSNMALRKKDNVTDLFDMVADILFEDLLPSDFSNRIKAIRGSHAQYKVDSFCLPVDQIKYGSIKMRYSKAYSAFGQSVIETQIEQSPDNTDFEQCNTNPLIKKLEEMSFSERKSVFQDCLENAMPWVDAVLEGIWTVDPGQYLCVIGVKGAEAFKKIFKDEFIAAIPERARLSADTLRFSETDIPCKITCYVELSGLPLTALTQLPKWRVSYEEESKKIPVHIHKDRFLFVHPLAPTSATLDRLAEHFKLFIQGIVLGVLKQRRNDSGNLDYCLTVSDEELSIGNERTIRIGGIAPEHLVYLQKKVVDAFIRIKSSSQYAGLVSLYDYYMQRVYSPAIFRDDRRIDILHKSFPYLMCFILQKETLKSLKENYSDEDTELIVRLIDKDVQENLEAFDLWTEEIEGSDCDVYEHEVGKSHGPKRILKPEFFQSGWLESRLKIGIKEPEEPKRGVGLQLGSGNSGTSCSSCGERVDGNPKFCPHCGSQMKSGNKCSGCGCAIEGNPKFCPECGAKQGVGLKCGSCGCSIEGCPKFCPECGKPV